MDQSAELDLLVTEQLRDDTTVILAERGHENDVRLDSDTPIGPEGETRVELLTRSDDGEIRYLVRPQKGELLNGSASYHGSLDGYTNHKCKCCRCRGAMATWKRERRSQLREAV